MDSPAPVVVPFERLADPQQDLSSALRKALGSEGLGLVLIQGVPTFPQARQRLLELTPRLAALSPDVLQELEDPESTYNFGWSRGKESLKSGQPDVAKGSFYANPMLDEPAQGDEQLMKEYPAYLRPNVWPSRPHQLPELELAFKQLGTCMYHTALLLAAHCDKLVAEYLPKPAQRPAITIQDVLRKSRNHKSRLLHYFPPAILPGAPRHAMVPGAGPDTQGAKVDQRPQPAGGDEHDQPWCGWHTDHGSLTGLTCAMYVDGAGQAVPCLDPDAGLYVRTRRGQVVKVAIPPDHLAFQVGEALQVQSGGVLMATPHYVRAVRGPCAKDVSRSTFATFLQPDVTFVLNAPPGVDEEHVSVGQWRRGQTFGAFSAATFSKYYRGTATTSQQEGEREGEQGQGTQCLGGNVDTLVPGVAALVTTGNGGGAGAKRQAQQLAAKAAAEPGTPVRGAAERSGPGTPLGGDRSRSSK